MAAKWIEFLTGSLDDKKAVPAVQGPHRGAARAVRDGREGLRALLHVQRRHHRRRPAVMITMLNDFADLWERAAADGTPVDEIVGDDPVEFAETFAAGLRGQALDRQGARPPDQDDPRDSAGRRDEMTTRCRHPGAGPGEVLQGPARAARRRLRRRARAASSPCSARTARARPRSCRILSTLLKPGRRHRPTVERLRRRHAAAERARVDQPDRAVRRRRRDPQRAREPRAGRAAAPPEEPRQDRGRPARPLLAHRGGRPQGGDLLGRHAPPARHRDEPHRQPAGDLPRRADDRPRPAGAHRGVADGEGTRRQAARPCC